MNLWLKVTFCHEILFMAKIHHGKMRYLLFVVKYYLLLNSNNEPMNTKNLWIKVGL